MESGAVGFRVRWMCERSLARVPLIYARRALIIVILDEVRAHL